MFLGRENEIAIIDGQLSRGSAFVIVYGTRRVGKTTLLKYALKRSRDRTIYFECLSGTLGYNAKRLGDVLIRGGLMPLGTDINNFIDIFAYLNDLEETFNIIIDEYPYLKTAEKAAFVDSVFQNIADNHLGNIRLFLSGSDVGMMRDLNRADNALYGRATKVVELKQWDYREAALCYPTLSPYDKVAFYSVFGGTPFVNTAIDSGKSLKENITALYLSEGGAARLYSQQLLLTGTSERSADIEPILSALGNGRKRYGELKNAVRVESDGVFSNHLEAAERLGLTAKVFPINKEGDTKKAHYEITDNALRFYYTYVYPYGGELTDMGADMFYDIYIAPSIGAFISHRFEDICRDFIRKKMRSGEYRDARRVGRFYFDNPAEKTNGEYDIAVKIEPYENMFCYDIYEAKYGKGPVTPKIIMDETEDIKKIKGLPIRSIGIFSVCGFADDCKGILISGEDLYK